MIRIVSALNHFEVVVDLFHNGFNQNQILEVRLGAVVGSCDPPLLSIYTYRNIGFVNPENDNARRRHPDVVHLPRKPESSKVRKGYRSK